MSKDLQEKQDKDGKAQGSPEHDLEAEHDPETSRRASNAGLQREVQKRAKGGGAENTQTAAARGVKSPKADLPHRAQIQSAFGGHDISGVEAHVGDRSAHAMGAEAYASGNHVVFGQQPDLHTAAHEVAHVVQQRGGVQLKGGVGESGDQYEQNADAVADRVVAGKSATDLLGGPGKSAGPQGAAVQKKDDPHETSNQDAFNGISADLELIAKEMHTATADLTKMQKNPSVGDAGDGPTMERIKNIYKETSHNLYRANQIAGTKLDKNHRDNLRAEMSTVKGAWEGLMPLMSWGLDYLTSKGDTETGRFVSTLNLAVEELTGRAGADAKQISSNTKEPTDSTDTLKKATVDQNFLAARSAADSVKAGNLGEAARVTNHLQVTVDAAAGLKAPMSKHKAELAALEKELKDLEKANSTLQFGDAHTLIQTLLKLA